MLRRAHRSLLSLTSVSSVCFETAFIYHIGEVTRTIQLNSLVVNQYRILSIETDSVGSMLYVSSCDYDSIVVYILKLQLIHVYLTTKYERDRTSSD